MLTKNKLGLTDSTEFAREEDRINKKKAVNLTLPFSSNFPMEHIRP